jgi:hypothetical protein
MKHLKLFENLLRKQTKTYWMIQDPGTGYYDDVTYLFDNESELFKFIMNRVYNIFKNNLDMNESDKSLEEYLSILDDCDDVEDLIEILNDAIDNTELGDYDTRLRLEITTLDENITLDKWIEERRTAKKYNL